MPHRKVHFSVFLVSRSILLCSFKCLSLVSFFGMVYISASFVVSIFLSPENIIVSFFSDIKEKCSSNVVEHRSSAQTTDFTTIGVRKKKKQTEKLVSICLKYVILECFTLTVLLRQIFGSGRFRAGAGSGWHRLRPDRPRGGECYHRLLLPSARRRGPRLYLPGHRPLRLLP